MKKTICKSNKAISLILAMAMLISVLSVCLGLPASAVSTKNLCENGNFETGDLTGYTYPYASVSDPIDPISVEQYTMNGTQSFAAKIMRDGDSLGTPNGRALNKKLELSAGKYLVTFDADISYNEIAPSKPTQAIIYGVYKGVDAAKAGNGRLFDSGAEQISTTSAAATFSVREGEKNGVSIYNYGNTSQYRLSFGSATANSVKCSIKMEFELNGSEENVFLSLCVNNYVTAYVDNIVVTREEAISDGVLITPNSDFENGNLNGFASGTKVEIVKAAKEADLGKTTFSGYAAYIPPRAGVRESNITYQMTAVPAGEYNITFDLDAFSGAFPSANGNILVGLYEGKPDSYNRGYNSNGLITELTVYDKNTNQSSTNISNGKYGSTVKFSDADSYANCKFTADFTLTEETDMFLGICFYFNVSDTANTEYAYLDNIRVTVADSEQLIDNGDFELGGLYGYEYATAVDTPVKVEKYAFDNGDENNYAAKLERGNSEPAGEGWKYAPGRALNKKLNGLEKGNYTLSFDVDATAEATYSLYYGVYNGTPNNYGRLYDTYEQISRTPADKTLVARTEDGLNGVFAAQDAGYSASSYRLSFGGSVKSVKAKVMLNFTVDGTENDLYFSVCVGNGTTAYIDNIKLYGIKFEQSFTNADYAQLTLKNAPFTGVDKIGYAVLMNGETVDISTKYFNSSAIGTVSYLRATENGVYYCDVNDDMRIDTTDIATLRKVLLETDVAYNNAAANVNGDEVIDIRDLIRIKKAFSETELGVDALNGSYNYLFKLGLKDGDTLQVTPYIISGGEKIAGSMLGMKYSNGKLESFAVESLNYDFADGTAADIAYIGEYK